MALTALCYLFASQIVSAFLTDATAYDYAVQFVDILLTTSFLFGVFYVLVNALQAMGAAVESLIIAISRCILHAACDRSVCAQVSETER